MEKHKEVFFVIRLHSVQSAASLAVSNFLVSSCTVSISKQNLIVFLLFSLFKILTLLSIVI